MILLPVPPGIESSVDYDRGHLPSIASQEIGTGIMPITIVFA